MWNHTYYGRSGLHDEKSRRSIIAMDEEKTRVCLHYISKKVTEMKTLELIQTVVIVVLAAVLGMHLVTDVTHTTQTSMPPVLAQEKEKSNIIETDDRQTVNSKDGDVVTSTQAVSLTTIFKQTENSVVQITSKVSTVNTRIIINGNPLESQSTRLGSGFVYDGKGHIITNNHVVEGAETVDVTFVDGNMYAAKVIGSDAYSDMAVDRKSVV